jgi:hypothetical protein
VTETPELPADESDKAAIYQSLGCIGCGLVVVAIFVALGLTISRANKAFTNEPEGVLANLQAVVPCEVPAGYRPLNSMFREGDQRMAILAPTSYDGEVIKVDVPLLIQAWWWNQTDRLMNLTVLMRFWEDRVADRFGEVQSVELGDPRQVTVRGAAASADVRWIFCTKGKLRVVSVWLDDQTAIAFLGLDDAFDEAAMKEFLASIR